MEEGRSSRVPLSMCSVSHNIYRLLQRTSVAMIKEQEVLATKVALFKVANFEKKYSLVACTDGMAVLWHNPSLSHGNAANGV